MATQSARATAWWGVLPGMHQLSPGSARWVASPIV